MAESKLQKGWFVIGSPEHKAWQALAANSSQHFPGAVAEFGPGEEGMKYVPYGRAPSVSEFNAQSHVSAPHGLVRNVAFNPETGQSIGLDEAGAPIAGTEVSRESDDTFWKAALAAAALASGAAWAAMGSAPVAAGASAAAGAGGAAEAFSMADAVYAGAAPAGGWGGGAAATTAASALPSMADSGSSLLGALKSGASNMSAGNWLQLASLGAGVVASKDAGGRADSALSSATSLANRQADLADRSFEWFSRAYNDQQPARDAAERRAQEISDTQLGGMRFATEQARELDGYNKAAFRPIEQRYISAATGYDTPERRAAAAGSAAADIDNSAALAREEISRSLGRAGVAPGSSRMVAAMEDGAIKQATARGGAMTRASLGVEQQGYARMADVVNLGRGVPTQQATQQQIASSTGNSSVGNAGAALSASMAGNPTMQAAFSNAMNGNNSAANLFSGVARAGEQQQSDLLAGISSIGRLFGGKP